MCVIHLISSNLDVLFHCWHGETFLLNLLWKPPGQLGSYSTICCCPMVSDWSMSHYLQLFCLWPCWSSGRMNVWTQRVNGYLNSCPEFGTPSLSALIQCGIFSLCVILSFCESSVINTSFIDWLHRWRLRAHRVNVDGCSVTALLRETNKLATALPDRSSRALPNCWVNFVVNSLRIKVSPIDSVNRHARATIITTNLV